MTNKNMVLCIYLVTGFLLYGLYFDIAWPFSPHNHYIVEVVCNGYSACLPCLCSDFITFPWPFKTTMCSLHPFEGSKIFTKTIDLLT